MLSILKGLSPRSIISALLVLALLAMLMTVMSLKHSNASLLLDNKVLSANVLVLKTTNTENITTIDHLKHQLQQREQIVYERSLIVTDIAASSVEVKHALVETIKESNDEAINAWVDESVPISIVRLLNNTRNNSKNQGNKDHPSSDINPRVSSADVHRVDQSRSG